MCGSEVPDAVAQGVVKNLMVVCVVLLLPVRAFSGGSRCATRVHVYEQCIFMNTVRWAYCSRAWTSVDVIPRSPAVAVATLWRKRGWFTQHEGWSGENNTVVVQCLL